MSADQARQYVIAYDVTDDRRRTRLAKQLEAVGDRVQYSVFLLQVRPAKLVRLTSALEGLMDRDEDSILICDLGPAGQAPQHMVTLGRGRPLTPTDFIIV